MDEVTVARMKEIEQAADRAGLSYTQMMENAGRGAAGLLLEQGPEDFFSAAVYCGTGNNGGDGFVAARALREAGKFVHIILVGGEPKTPDAILNLERARALKIPVEKLEELTEESREWAQSADVVVDALYGTGFHGSLRPEARAACRLMNNSWGFLLSLDLPSGVQADTGDADDESVTADLTAAFHACKPCHRLNPVCCGRTEVISIGAEKVLGGEEAR